MSDISEGAVFSIGAGGVTRGYPGLGLTTGNEVGMNYDASAGARRQTSAVPGTGILDLSVPGGPLPFIPSSGLLSDIDIEQLCRDTERPMISPFSEKMKEGGVISYGLSSYGYDARVAPDFKVFTNVNNTLVDPKNFDESCFVHKSEDHCIIPPHSFILCHTIEYFKMPRDVLAICMAKSTYARCGLVVGVTPLEPGWEGQVTIEISNTTPLPAKVYANEGVCQFLFFRGGRPCRIPYDARGGKYMGQRGVVLPRIHEEPKSSEYEAVPSKGTVIEGTGQDLFHHPV